MNLKTDYQDIVNTTIDDWKVLKYIETKKLKTGRETSIYLCECIKCKEHKKIQRTTLIYYSKQCSCKREVLPRYRHKHNLEMPMERLEREYALKEIDFSNLNIRDVSKKTNIPLNQLQSMSYGLYEPNLIMKIKILNYIKNN